MNTYLSIFFFVFIEKINMDSKYMEFSYDFNQI